VTGVRGFAAPCGWLRLHRGGPSFGVEIDDRVEVVVPAREAVVAAGQYGLTRAGIAAHGVAVIQGLVALLDQQPEAFGPGQDGDRDGAQLLDMIQGEVEALAGIQPALRPDVFLQRKVGHHGGIHQHRLEVELLRQPGRVVAAQRGADHGRHAVAGDQVFRQGNGLARGGRQLRRQ
jgi:hypothetical protein